MGGAVTLFALLALLFAGCNLDGSSGGGDSTPSHSDETGTSELIGNVYHVYDLEGLKAWVAYMEEESDYSASCTLHACIDLSEDYWTPIGGDYSSAYTGAFDGGGHTIYNLKIESSDEYAYRGFFGYVGVDGAVKNLTLDNPIVSATYYAGGIAGYNEGSIESCTVSGGTVSATGGISFYPRAGGIVGWNEGTVDGCANSSTVSANFCAGGIAGDNGSVSGTAKVTGCTNSGTVSSTSTDEDFRAGGIVGDNYGTVDGCTNSGKVSTTTTGESDNSYAGGIAGANYGGDVKNCENSGTVSAGHGAGGVVGYNGSDSGTAKVTGCTNSGNVSATATSNNPVAGGIVGWNGNTITGCTNYGEVSATNGTAGGIVGYNENGTVSNCTNTGTLKGSNTNNIYNVYSGNDES